MWSKLSAFPRGAIILAIPILSILPAIATWSWSYQSKKEANLWIDHTKEVISESRLLRRILVDAETGIRGYAITKKPEFLEPYRKAEQSILPQLVRLTDLVADNPQQQQAIGKIEQRVQTRLELLTQVEKIIEAEQDKNNSPQLSRLFAEGKAEMDSIRQSLDRFQNQEWQLLDERQQTLAKINRITNIALVVSIFSILSGYALAVKLYLQSERQQKAKAAKLKAANQLLASRNQELDQFTYIVSHDLKAPLRAISNLSNWIEEDLADKMDEDSKKNMTLLRKRVARMDMFISSLLEYARAGKSKEDKKTVDVRELLQEIIDSIAPPPSFVVNIDGKMPVMQTEALLLQQVFSNLVSNAIKHHHRDEGEIVISAIEQGKYYQFSVADDGAGIAAEHQEKIFAIFQTLVTKDTKANTGIGLSIVKKIVENHGGKIWLESELDRGTTFYFTWSIE